MIDVARLEVRVPGFRLSDISFTIPARGVGVLTGPTGAGKTTLVETIAGVRPRVAGSIRLDGVDVSALPPEQRRVGLVYQQAWLFPHLTVRENVAYGARRAGLVDDLIAAVQIGALLEKPVPTLSGGERQLVALARALACEPRTLLLDEPFAAMDGALRATTRETVLGWAAAHDLTTLLISHDPAECTAVAAVRLHLERGTLARRADP